MGHVIRSHFASRLAVMCALAFTLTACGGGGSAVVVAGSPEVIGLDLQLVRIGPATIEVDWSIDPLAVSYLVERDGYTLAHVVTDTLIDNSVMIDEQYCYRVSGFDRYGALVAISQIGCLTLFP